MDEIKTSRVDRNILDSLLGIDSSKIGYYSEVKHKIQELGAANVRLQVKKRELQAVFDAISDGVVIYDSEGHVQYRNHVCHRLFPDETIVGGKFSHLFKGEFPFLPVDNPVQRAIYGESSQFSFSQFNEEHKGTGHYDVIVTPLVAHAEEPQDKGRALVFIRDVTERRMREMQLLQAEKMSSIGLLAAGVAHEINNPMTSVAGYAEALQRRFRDDLTLAGDQRLIDFPRYLDVIVREVYRCKAIINSLQSFSRKSDGVASEIDLNEIIEEVIELARHIWRGKEISVDKELSGCPAVVRADSNAMRQIILNIVVNGLQAIEEKGTVTIASKVEDGSVVVRIIDNGCGIPPEDLDRIWTPFYTTKLVGRGQGLGLAVTYDLVEKHQGTIAVESAIGEGTQFILKFPKC
jgi:signal transduction histidine kinase